MKVDLQDKNKLHKLYIEQKLSTYKIAKKLSCDPKTVYYWLNKHKIKTRSVAKSPISQNVLSNLYTDKHMSLKQIGKIYQMTPSGILKRIKKACIKTRKSWETNTGIKKPFIGNNIEKSYLIGFRIGDLGIRESSPKTKLILVGSNTTKREQISLMSNLFKNYSKVWVSKPNHRGVMSFSTILHPSFLFLLPKYDNIEKWIVQNNKYMTAFVAGYIDAEGSFSVYNKRGKFRVGSYDKNILNQIHQWLSKLDIKSVLKLERLKKTGQNQDFWRITINDAASLYKLYLLIYGELRHTKRKLDFDSVKENILLRSKHGTIHL